jgi:hypothetical protein
MAILLLEVPWRIAATPMDPAAVTEIQSDLASQRQKGELETQ